MEIPTTFKKDEERSEKEGVPTYEIKFHLPRPKYEELLKEATRGRMIKLFEEKPKGKSLSMYVHGLETGGEGILAMDVNISGQRTTIKPEKDSYFAFFQFC